MPSTSGSKECLSRTSSNCQSESCAWSTPQPQPKRVQSSSHMHHSLNVDDPWKTGGTITTSNGLLLCNGGGDERVPFDKHSSFSSSSEPKRSTLPTNFKGLFSESSSPPTLFSEYKRRSGSEQEISAGPVKLLDLPRSLPTATECPLLQAPQSANAKESQRKGSSPTLLWKRHKKSHSLGTK